MTSQTQSRDSEWNFAKVLRFSRWKNDIWIDLKPLKSNQTEIRLFKHQSLTSTRTVDLDIVMAAKLLKL